MIVINDRMYLATRCEFGGGKTPTPPPPPPAPSRGEAAMNVGDTSKRRGMRKPEGYQSTILGGSAGASGVMKTLLGG